MRYSSEGILELLFFEQMHKLIWKEKINTWCNVCGLTCGIDRFDEVCRVRLFKVSNKGGFAPKGKVGDATAPLLPAERTTELAVVDVMLRHVTPENLH